MPPKKANQEAPSKVSKSNTTGIKKAAGSRKRSAPSRANTRGDARDSAAATPRRADAVPGLASVEAATARVPRLETWETIDWDDGHQWQIGLTRQEHFDWIPRRLEQFLNGPETHTRDFWYWHRLANFLRSKVPVASPADGGHQRRPPNQFESIKETQERQERGQFCFLVDIDDDWKVH